MQADQLTIDMNRLAHMIGNDIFSGPNWYTKTTSQLMNCIIKKQPFTIHKIETTDYGSKLILRTETQHSLELSKGKVRTRDIDNIFGKQPKQEAVYTGPTEYSREATHSDPRKLTPKFAAGAGERVKLSNGQIWEYKGISGYKADNRQRINGWEQVSRAKNCSQALGM